jgi:hypothetical protein
MPQPRPDACNSIGKAMARPIQMCKDRTVHDSKPPARDDE